MYIALFVLLRVILKRQAGTLGMTDLLLVTLLADASQNAMAGQYNSVPDGVTVSWSVRSSFGTTLSTGLVSSPASCGA